MDHVASKCAKTLCKKRKVKKLNTFVANLLEFIPNFLKRPVPPRLLQKVWGFFVMMIDVEGKAIGEALSRKKTKIHKNAHRLG